MNEFCSHITNLTLATSCVIVQQNSCEAEINIHHQDGLHDLEQVAFQATLEWVQTEQ